jgi:peroxiredoxin
MLTPQQAFRVFGYANCVMMLAALVAGAIAIGLGVCAIFIRDKHRRSRILRRAVASCLVFMLFFGTLPSATIVAVNDQWTALLIILFTLPMVVLAPGFLVSVVYGWRALLWKAGADRRQAVLKSCLGVVVFGIGLGPHTAAMLMITATEDHSSYAGTLIHIGDRAPNFEIATVEGTPFRTVDVRGRVVVLSFFATWCGPCQKELPHLQTLWEEFRGNGDFRMLVVGRGESDQVVKAFRQQHRFTFPMAADPQRSVSGNFASQYIPRTYLISREGIVVHEWTGYYETEIAKLRKLLRKELAKND